RLRDDPTPGLDAITKATTQRCLRDLNESRGVTILLTSHYMRDVEALCKRVLVIAHGKLVYDGALGGITDRFCREKLVKLQFEGTDSPSDLGQFGEVASREGPVVDL